MALTYGFYNSISGDRRYNAKQMSTLFDGIIRDGVFATVGQSLMVSAGSDMTINVGTGRAWFNGTWTNNDAPLPLVVPPSETVLNRIDAVVLEVNETNEVRANSIKILKGTPATIPTNPTLTNSELVHQYPLAYIYVGANVSSIIQANITNKIGTTSTPFVTGILQTVTAEMLTAQWESEFDTWLNHIKDLFGDDPAGSLQNQIDELGAYAIAGGTNSYTATINGYTLAEGKTIRIKFTNANTGASTLNINSFGAKSILKGNGNDLSSGNIKAGQICNLVYTGSVFQLLGEGGEYGTATASDVLQGKTIGTENGLVTGTMPNRGAVSNTITTQGGSYTIPSGYHSGSGKVTASFSNLSAGNIKSGVNIGGVVGTYTQGIRYKSKQYICAGTSASTFGITSNYVQANLPRDDASAVFTLPISVNMAYTVINKVYADEGNRGYRIKFKLTSTNKVTGYKTAGKNMATGLFEVLEFYPEDVKSFQSGEVTGKGTSTFTINAVDVNKTVVYVNGHGKIYSDYIAEILGGYLINSTTLQVMGSHSSGLEDGGYWYVVEFN